jgi:asparagine synthase (glutamine-hydrolysing)
MCGIAGLVQYTRRVDPAVVLAMRDALAHRGPDDAGLWHDGVAVLGLRRLSILDRSAAGHQPMTTPDGRLVIVFNGEVYNYLELRRELGAETFRSGTDTEVVLRAFEKWGPACLDRLRGMFAFAIWDGHRRELFAARDRFGVKPFYYAAVGDGLAFASEIKALFQAGVAARPDLATWSTYLCLGLSDHDEATFYEGVRQLRGGCALWWRDGALRIERYYDLTERVRARLDSPAPTRAEAARQYTDLLDESVRLRFRSDVPVGLCLSGGLDSSVLLATASRVLGADVALRSFTYTCNDPVYDERPYVELLLERSSVEPHFTELGAGEVPDLAARVSRSQDEPFGGLPTLALSKLFRQARACGVTVLLDGQGLDEQWAGYDYYARALEQGAGVDPTGAPVQGGRSPGTRPGCLAAPFRTLCRTAPVDSRRLRPLIDARITDIVSNKIPRAVRFGDRVSMDASCELREPFLDHNLVEFALALPDDLLIRDGVHKALLREMFEGQLPKALVEAPKRPLQTPQREWLAGPLRGWVSDLLASEPLRTAGWFDVPALQREYATYVADRPDSSYHVWQWVSAALFLEAMHR